MLPPPPPPPPLPPLPPSGSRKVREPGDRVRSVGVRARPATLVPQPRVVEKGSGLRLRHRRRHRRCHPHPASRDGGHSVAHARCSRRSAGSAGGARTACWGGGRKAAERTQAGTSRRKTNLDGEQCLDCLFEKNLATQASLTLAQQGRRLARTGTHNGTRKEFLNASPSQSTLARQGRGLAHTNTMCLLRSHRTTPPC